MCRDCGCSDPTRAQQLAHEHEHAHEHAHGHVHQHDHHDGPAHPLPTERTISVERSVLELNDHLAMHNREQFAQQGVLAINLMSSPGAGKTRLLERTLGDLADRLAMGVIVGDLETDNDAQRLRHSGAPVISITTGTMCHLEADMVGRACGQLDLAGLDVLFIENVGNLVCPASFDLGEELRVVLMSVTEGEDKPLKYPPMFKGAHVVLLTKMDLTEAAGFDRAQAVENIRRVAPQAVVVELSARTAEGMADWYESIEQRTLRLGSTRKAMIARSSTR